MANNPKINVDVWLLNVRLSYPRLYVPEPFNKDKPISDDNRATYGLTTIMEKGSAAHKAAAQAVQQVIAMGYPNGKPGNLVHCLRLGEEKRQDDGTYKEGYGPDVVFVNANNEDRFTVTTRARVPVNDGERGAPYAGCYVNVHMRFWLMDNKKQPTWGKKILAQPLGCQFVADGTAFGGGGRSTSPDEFPNLEGDESAIEQWGDTAAVDENDPLFC